MCLWLAESRYLSEDCKETLNGRRRKVPAEIIHERS
jgi:hypothetical protein